jgi:hypothetical protein
MEESRDQIAILLHQEQHQYACSDYMAHERTTTVPASLDFMNMLEECANLVNDRSFNPRDSVEKPLLTKVPSVVCVRQLMEQVTATTIKPKQPAFGFWRQQMFDWACMVVDSFGMDREVVAMSFSILDRFIATEASGSSASITRHDFQLFSMTSLYLVIKITVPYPCKLGVEALVDMSRGFYSSADIILTERDILKALEWHVHPPTAMGFCRLYWSFLSQEPSVDMQMTCATMTDITVADPLFVSYKPSAIGLAVVLHAARLDGADKRTTERLLSKLQGLVSTSNNQDFDFVFHHLEKLYCQ